MHQHATALIGAEVIDGTGSAPVRRDLLVHRERIVAIEKPGALAAHPGPVIELDGLVLTPGFIDVHSHADNAPFLSKDDTSKLLQGVTTEIVGNCGFGLASGIRRPHHAFGDVVQQFFPPDTPTFGAWGEYLAAIDHAGLVTNHAVLAAHGTLRAAVMGMSAGVADRQELGHMRTALERAFDEGAFGLSTGLIYSPGMYASTDELVELASALPAAVPYVTHLRGEGQQLDDSIAEAIRIARRADRPLHISHLKAAGRRNWGRMGDVLGMLDRAREEGVDIRQDVYPYTAGSTMLAALLPPDVRNADHHHVLSALGDPRIAETIARRWEKPAGDWENLAYENGWDNIVVSSTGDEALVGRTVAQIARESGRDPAQVAMDLLQEDSLRTGMIIHSMHVDDLAAVVTHPATMFGSDGLPPGGSGLPHPRMHGTFPRVLARLVRDDSSFTLQEAVRRMTGLPAASFGLRDRGVIAVDAIADLVAFSPENITDTATYADPRRAPRGIAWVMMAGTLVAAQGRFLGERRGQRLERGA